MPSTEPSFFESALPRVFAHRGLATDAPENTLLAFLKALSAGATHLETDVHASADGVAVISHDADLRRLAERDVRVEQLTMAELRRVDLGEGQAFCSLAEALDAFPTACFNVDIKAAAAVDPVVAAVRDARAERRVLLASFDEGRRVAATLQLEGVATSASSKTVAAALLAVRMRSGRMLARALSGVHAVQVPERYGSVRVVTRRFVDMVHAAGVEVHVWTVNEPDDMERLVEMGVDGVVTDRADLAVERLKPGGKGRGSRK
ncbi:glycerophosphodiester phosphodiesterase [Salinibacterium sp. dk2585]|uniref:glycerophosphodiester phosphodiesterase family protein n=1 Tax=unclassified Salinibacterium TaxID=2632331 RepID=UPI0011C24365|nr:MULTISPECIES: glycerophosphodiester phosphodiesterase family protein [unclassified Salinibacterium]QEE61150.1 glycerophosphodiester phosphodiesterase [Salinibacterium sp. dk2585]TXK53093.1 glycerophosphodiester phosphodiesterase [Salinibacterium sp. dk5596]